MPIGRRLGVFFYKLDPPHQLAGFELMGFNAGVPDGSKPSTAMGRVGTETRKRITLKVPQGRGGAGKDVVCWRNKTYAQPLTVGSGKEINFTRKYQSNYNTHKQLSRHRTCLALTGSLRLCCQTLSHKYLKRAKTHFSENRTVRLKRSKGKSGKWCYCVRVCTVTRDISICSKLDKNGTPAVSASLVARSDKKEWLECLVAFQGERSRLVVPRNGGIVFTTSGQRLVDEGKPHARHA